MSDLPPRLAEVANAAEIRRLWNDGWRQAIRTARDAGHDSQAIADAAGEPLYVIRQVLGGP